MVITNPGFNAKEIGFATNVAEERLGLSVAHDKKYGLEPGKNANIQVGYHEDDTLQVFVTTNILQEDLEHANVRWTELDVDDGQLPGNFLIGEDAGITGVNVVITTTNGTADVSINQRRKVV